MAGRLSDSADEAPRSRGRPRTPISLDAVVDAVASLFAEGGIDAVLIVSTARKLNVSRATLSRWVSTKEHLLGMLFERSTQELTALAEDAVAKDISVAQKLGAPIELQIGAAIRCGTTCRCWHLTSDRRRARRNCTANE